ncbi:MAG: hypothetical protein N2450_04480 [bacterium]|nr:hypothetical protein [bacterium]
MLKVVMLLVIIFGIGCNRNPIGSNSNPTSPVIHVTITLPNATNDTLQLPNGNNIPPYAVYIFCRDTASLQLQSGLIVRIQGRKRVGTPRDTIAMFSPNQDTTANTAWGTKNLIRLVLVQHDTGRVNMDVKVYSNQNLLASKTKSIVVLPPQQE